MRGNRAVSILPMSFSYSVFFFCSIASNLRSLVYSIGVREGGVKEWNQVYDKYKSTNIASEKAILLTSLTCTRNPQMIEK